MNKSHSRSRGLLAVSHHKKFNLHVTFNVWCDSQRKERKGEKESERTSSMSLAQGARVTWVTCDGAALSLLLSFFPSFRPSCSVQLCSLHFCSVLLCSLFTSFRPVIRPLVLRERKCNWTYKAASTEFPDWTRADPLFLLPSLSLSLSLSLTYSHEVSITHSLT